MTIFLVKSGILSFGRSVKLFELNKNFLTSFPSVLSHQLEQIERQALTLAEFLVSPAKHPHETPHTLFMIENKHKKMKNCLREIR